MVAKLAWDLVPAAADHCCSGEDKKKASEVKRIVCHGKDILAWIPLQLYCCRDEVVIARCVEESKSEIAQTPRGTTPQKMQPVAGDAEDLHHFTRLPLVIEMSLVLLAPAMETPRPTQDEGQNRERGKSHSKSERRKSVRFSSMSDDDTVFNSLSTTTCRKESNQSKLLRILKVRSGGSGQTFALPTKKKVSEQMEVASAPTYASILKKGLKWAPVTVHSF